MIFPVYATVHVYTGQVAFFNPSIYLLNNCLLSKICRFTGWPIKHGREFLVSRKKWLFLCMLLYTCTLDKSLILRYQKKKHLTVHHVAYNCFYLSIYFWNIFRKNDKKNQKFEDSFLSKLIRYSSLNEKNRGSLSC